jgi:hypothetical protein
MNPLAQILLYQEIEEDKKELTNLGLTEEDIEGYVAFYIDSYIEEVDTQTERKE